MGQYRGKVKSDDPVISKRWAYGDKVTIGKRVFIVPDDAEIVWHWGEGGIFGFVEVIPESVGQSTGEKDCNKQEVYDRDWVKASIYGDEEPQILQVCWRKGGYVIDYEDSESDCVLLGEFVGSLELTDNPKLLESD